MKRSLLLFLLIFQCLNDVAFSTPVRQQESAAVASFKVSKPSSKKDKDIFKDKEYWHTWDEDFSCFVNETSNPLSVQPTMTYGHTGRAQLCCVTIENLQEVGSESVSYWWKTNNPTELEEDDIPFVSFHHTDHKEKQRRKNFLNIKEVLHHTEKKEAWCYAESSFLKCCCAKDKCNSLNFAKHNLALLDYSPLLFTGFVGIELLASLILIAVTLGITFAAARFTCLDKFTDEARVELPAMKNVDLRGIIVQPYHSPEEVEAILSQIKNAKNKKALEPATTFKKVKFCSVTTFSTIDDLTIREPAPIELPSLTSKDPCMEMITHMVKNGPREIKFDPHALLLCYDRALKVLKSEPILQEATLPIAIYGDLHGQYSDLIRWFHVNGWPPTTRCIFMGDYVDRGRHCLEVITLLLCLKAVMPNDVYINRGNHEDAVISKNYSFYAEAINRLPSNSKLNQQVFDKLAECFAWMPLATRLNEKILCLHGGLSPRLLCWESIASVKRPVMNLTPNTLPCDLTWSDPDRKSRDYIVNFKRDKKNGIGYMFGTTQVKEVCKLLDIQLILRGHQAPMNGYELFSPKMCTVFSAPGYRGIAEEANFGASMFIDEHGNIHITRIGVSSNVRRERNRQKLDKGEGYLDWAEIKDRPLEDDDERSC